EAVLRASAMTAALGLELLERGPLELSRLPRQYVRAVDSVLSGAARLVLHKWCEASQAQLGDDLTHLASLAPGELAGVE
ncbi:MAG: hypothetical protein ACM31C_12440, partial [Acidobacteriota bacterium]